MHIFVYTFKFAYNSTDENCFSTNYIISCLSIISYIFRFIPNIAYISRNFHYSNGEVFRVHCYGSGKEAHYFVNRFFYETVFSFQTEFKCSALLCNAIAECGDTHHNDFLQMKYGNRICVT
jgi:hypothetical protein